MRDFIRCDEQRHYYLGNVKRTIISNNGVTFADADIINRRTVSEVHEIMRMKFNSDANLCFNLNRLTSLPAFYNSPGACGEGAFMSTTLTNPKVPKVPCFTFHDAFLEYKKILTGSITFACGAV